MSNIRYTVRRAGDTPELTGQWDGPVWGDVPTIEVAHFHERGTEHRPRTLAKLLYDDAHLYVHFQVDDRCVRSVATQHQQNVCWDSCVEFFTTPVAGKGYFNFEVNAGGTVLLAYGSSMDERVPVSDDWLTRMCVYHSLPDVVEPELTEPTTWRVEYAVPFELFEAYVGPCALPGNQPWHANLYKCGDRTSMPHWGMWQPITTGKFSFHRPDAFAPIAFEGLTR